ncbi:MAG: FkbM family methyltransferase [Ignavibacteriales bacterium]|nr:FkbM family methyltransferase [Ignavibacteriales bacterium]
MYVDPSFSAVVPELLRDDIYEADETRLLQSILREGDTFVDVGANIGYYSLFAGLLVKEKGRVISFEPEPFNFSYLQKNVSLNNLTNVIMEQKAISDRKGQLRLFLDKTNSGAHHLYNLNDQAEEVIVEAITLDEYFSPSSQRVDLIKMDIQGYEPFALKGMENIIRQNPSLKIITEYWPPMIKKAGFNPEDYLKSLTSLGFHFTIINGQHIQNVEFASFESIAKSCEEHEFINLLCEKG